jgi:hypothetical protein
VEEKLAPLVRYTRVASRVTSFCDMYSCYIAPALSRTPSTNTITQSRANTQQAQPLPVRRQSIRSNQRPNITSPKFDERYPLSAGAPPSPLKESLDSPDSPNSASSSSSSLSDAGHAAHRSQLFKHPPRFKQQRPRELSIFEESGGAQDIEVSDTHEIASLPFASAATRPTNTKNSYNIPFRGSIRSKEEVQKAPVILDKSVDRQSKPTAETNSSMTTSAAGSDVPVPNSAAEEIMSPSANHRTELARLGSPRRKDTRSGREGSEGTPSMGSSFSDIDGKFQTSARGRLAN